MVCGMVLSYLLTRAITHPVRKAMAELTAETRNAEAVSLQFSISSNNLSQGASEQAADIKNMDNDLEMPVKHIGESNTTKSIPSGITPSALPPKT